VDILIDVLALFAGVGIGSSVVLIYQKLSESWPFRIAARRKRMQLERDHRWLD